MKQNKLEFEQSISDIRETEKDYRAALRKEVIAAGGSCLSCKYTKTAVGVRLKCELKTKYVSQYSYCEFWKTEEKKAEGETK